MIRSLLAVYHRAPLFFCPGDQGSKCDLGAIGLASEHRLTKQHSPKAYAVKPADELPLATDLDAVGKPHAMEIAVSLLYGRGNPGSPLPRSGFRAGSDHRLKILVCTDLKGRVLNEAGDGFAQRLTDLELVKHEYHSR